MGEAGFEVPHSPQGWKSRRQLLGCARLSNALFVRWEQSLRTPQDTLQFFEEHAS
jgi:hypothetical protein